MDWLRSSIVPLSGFTYQVLANNWSFTEHICMYYSKGGFAFIYGDLITPVLSQFSRNKSIAKHKHQTFTRMNFMITYLFNNNWLATIWKQNLMVECMHNCEFIILLLYII